MSTLKQKTKSKRTGKSNRSEPRNLDLSELRKPAMISVSSLKEAAKLLETGTPEIRDLLTYEVNPLYECRVCRSIFRSLVNLLSHKRAFCKEKVSIYSENKLQGDKANSSNISPNNLEYPEFDNISLSHLINPSNNDRILRSQAPGKTNKKDLTSVLDMLQKKQVEHFGELEKQRENHVEETECDQVVLQVLNSKRAAYQTLVQPNSSHDDLMGNQVIELDNILNQDTVVLGPDGQIEPSDSPVHFYASEDQEVNKLTCNICSYTFSTQKTLNSHIEIKHASVRDCYMCPCYPCQDSFTSLASVKRHLTNVHRKIGRELKNLGQQAEKRTLRTKVNPVVMIKKSRKPENSRNSVDNSQAPEWIDHLDRQVEMHECTSCRERFDEKSELLIHSRNCFDRNNKRIPSRIALNNDIFYQNDPDEEENLMETSSLEVNAIFSQNVSHDNQECSIIDVSSTTALKEEENNDLSIRVHGVSSLSEEDWKKLPEWSSENEENTMNPTNNIITQELIFRTKTSNKSSITHSRVLHEPEIIYAGVDNSKKRKFSSLSECIQSVAQGEKFKKISCEKKLKVEKVETGKANTQLFSKKIASISDHTKLKCNACKKSFTNITSLNRHMENHIKINRYRCNKCDFKSINRSDCVGHCNKMHNAMNNRQVLNEMISELSQDQLTLSQEMIVDSSNLNSLEMRQAFSNIGCQLENSNPVTDVLPNHSQPFVNPVKNFKDTNSSRLISDSINPSDTDTENEDRESIYRRIDSNPNLREMIREVVIGTNSNLNGVNQSLAQNNNLEKNKKNKLDGFSLPIDGNDFNTNYFNEEDKISPEIYSRERSNSRSSKRSKLRIETKSSLRMEEKMDSDDEDEISPEIYPRERSNSRSSKSNSSQNAKRSESRIETRCSSRLGRKLDSDDEDEISSELCQGKRSSFKLSRRSSPTIQTFSESRVITRSRSRLGNNSRLEEDENDENYWKDYSKDLSSEEKSPRSKSRIVKCAREIREGSVSRKSRGKSRGKRSLPAKMNHNSLEKEERRESYGNENSQIQRPTRNRIKPVDKNFIYDLQDVTLQKDLSYFPSSSSRKKSSNDNSFNEDSNFKSDPTTQLFVNDIDDLDIENSESFFLGFPRQPEIMNAD